jgi:hypothetical protein
VKIERQPLEERPSLWKKWHARFNLKPNSMKFGLTLIPLKVLPDIYSAAGSACHYRADLGATAILLAAERHRQKTGKWPESIAAIDRGILPNAPDDPYSGQPFHFERRAGELLIYSVGENLKDEHGERDPAVARRQVRGPDDVTARGRDVSRRRKPPPPKPPAGQNPVPPSPG